MTFTVPVVGSTWLSTTVTCPCSIVFELSESSARASSGPLASAWLTTCRFCCASVNTMAIGLICVIDDDAGRVVACTMLPGSTCLMPVRPSSGERIVV